jgi:hypothetical protein
MLELKYLQINRLVIHHIHSRDAERNFVKPNCANALLKLPQAALDMFTKRIAQALGNRSHGIKVDVQNSAAGSFFQQTAGAMRSADADFLTVSQQLANDLAQAQLARDLPDSKLIVVSGVVEQAQRPFLAVIKAETQDGLAERKQGAGTQIDYLTNIFLTETQRLYKIGYVQQAVGQLTGGGGFLPKEFAVHLFDHVMTGTETRGAAIYFYNGFMGTDISASDKRLTQNFYENTLAFIDSRPLDPSDRLDLLEALRSELRSNKQTLSVGDFADDHFAPADRGPYAEHMERANFPAHAVSKNTEFIASKLKRRQRVVFSSGVMITTPPDRLKELVKVAVSVDGLTTVTISGTVQTQE